jgi:hypothetical protein
LCCLREEVHSVHIRKYKTIPHTEITSLSSRSISDTELPPVLVHTNDDIHTLWNDICARICTWIPAYSYTIPYHTHRGPYHVNIVDGCSNICIYHFEEKFVLWKCLRVCAEHVLMMHCAHIHIQKLFVVAINYEQCVH